MKRLRFWALALLICIPWLVGGQQQEADPPQLDLLFVRITIYPTVSLSRYDYNNDLDLYELRAYVELRDKSPTGELISDAQIYVNSQLLDYRTDHYEKRIKVSRENPQNEIDIRIDTADERQVRQRVSIPTWLILDSPKPEIVDSTADLKVSWLFTKCSCSVEVSAYNFKTGDAIIAEKIVAGRELTIPGSEIPKDTIVRVFVMQSWYFKRYLRGRELVRGSEVTVIPWSQVFLRTR